MSSLANLAIFFWLDSCLLVSVLSCFCGMPFSSNTAAIEVVLTTFVVDVIVAVRVSSTLEFLSIFSADDASASSFFAKSVTFCSVGSPSNAKVEEP